MSAVSVIDYGVGNLFSVRHALTVAAGRRDIEIRIDSDPHRIARADAIVLPGVGHFDTCARALRAREGLAASMTGAVCSRGVPFLGICVGMQLLVDRSDEGTEPGLGWIAGDTVALPPVERIPHMGWNTVSAVGTALFAGIDQTDMYFAHSYVVVPRSDGQIAATCRYGQTFAAAIAERNVFGVQFHPEKSQTAGQAVLANFLGLVV